MRIELTLVAALGVVLALPATTPALATDAGAKSSGPVTLELSAQQSRDKKTQKSQSSNRNRNTNKNVNRSTNRNTTTKPSVKSNTSTTRTRNTSTTRTRNTTTTTRTRNNKNATTTRTRTTTTRAVRNTAPPRRVTFSSTRKTFAGTRARTWHRSGTWRYAGRNYSYWRSGPWRHRYNDTWRTYVALSALTGILVGATTYYPYAYVSMPVDYCEGITEDGCQLTWTEVETLEGGVAPACVAYCPWQ